MGADSKIEWTDHTFNPWWGCTKVSPGCDNCYAETLAKRWGFDVWGPRMPRRFFEQKHWDEPLRWERSAARAGARRRVFCASMADVFDNEVPSAWRRELWKLIAITPYLDWLLLTKRIGNVPKVAGFFDGWPRNVWLGASIVNQEEADRDIPKLLRVPVVGRFLSCEPLLGPIDLAQWLRGFTIRDGTPIQARKLDWVIAGGESGPGARPMHPDWARSLRDQCQAAGVAFFFKQWGEWLPRDHDNGQISYGRDRLHVWDEKMQSYAVGKKAAGRLLDGAEHSAFPLSQQQRLSQSAA